MCCGIIFAGICDPDIIVTFILPDNPSAVMKHNMERSWVIQIDSQVDFFLRDDI